MSEREINARMQDEAFWPPSVSLMEEMSFVISLRGADEERMLFLIDREKRRRLESGEDRLASHAEFPFEIVLLPHQQNAPRSTGGQPLDG